MKQSFANVIAVLFAAIALQSSVFAKPAVIVNLDCNASATLNKVRNIFLGKERSLCGSTAMQAIDVDEQNPLRAIYLNKVLEKNEDQLRQYWSRLIFTGRRMPPKNVGSKDEDVRTWVLGNKNAIGIIDSANVDKSVKVLLVIE